MDSCLVLVVVVTSFTMPSTIKINSKLALLAAHHYAEVILVVTVQLRQSFSHHYLSGEISG